MRDFLCRHGIATSADFLAGLAFLATFAGLWLYWLTGGEWL